MQCDTGSMRPAILTRAVIIAAANLTRTATANEYPVAGGFTLDGQRLGSITLIGSRPRNESVVHWQWGGAYPRRAADAGYLPTSDRHEIGPPTPH